MSEPVEWGAATLRSVRDLTPDIRLFEIEPEGEFVHPTPGSHINVAVLIGGRADVRSYSIVGPCMDGFYRIAVKLLGDTRGGSAYMWSLAPGAKLNERELSEQLQVSRTPLREAIKMLAAEGLVELLPNRGAAVAQMSEQDVADTFEVIAGLEGQSGELAAQRITEAELAEIRALHYEMLAAYTRRDLPTYYRINAQIHTLINAAARNPVLMQTWRTVNARLQSLKAMLSR